MPGAQESAPLLDFSHHRHEVLARRRTLVLEARSVHPDINSLKCFFRCSLSRYSLSTSPPGTLAPSPDRPNRPRLEVPHSGKGAPTSSKARLV